MFPWFIVADLEPSKRKSLGRSVRLFTEQYFDLRDTTEKYKKLYQSLSGNVFSNFSRLP
jgi:hypothetical protein